MDSMTLTTKQIDRDLTSNWQDVCLGHFSLRLPPNLLPLQKRDVRFDGYEFEVLPARYDKALHSEVLEKEQKISALQVPDGLNSVIHREEGDRRNHYLIAYRDGGNDLPHLVNIEGYKKISNKILHYQRGISDGYKRTPPEKSISRNQRFENIYSSAQRILKFLEPVKNQAKPGNGFCLDNQFIIRGNSVTGTGDITKFSMPSDEYFFKIKISTLAGTKNGFNLREHLKKISQNKDIPGEVQLVTVNDMEGGFMRTVDEDYYGAVEYGWLYVESLPNTKRKLVIQIELEERDSPYIGKDKDELDQIFTNILASFHRRG